MANTQSNRAKITEEIRNILGEGMVDVELDPKHYEQGIDLAVDKFRAKSDNSTEEAFIFLELQADINEYTLSEEVIEVKQLYRRSISGSNNSVDMDPFELAYTNLYFLQGGRIGGLLTWDAFAQYQEVVRRLFGGHLNFKFNTNTKVLELMRRPRANENILVQCYMEKPVDTLITDRYARPWIRDYSLAQCKMMLGEARSKYSSLPGAQGNVTLNGDALKQEAQAELDKLEEDLKLQVAGGMGYGFTIG